MLRTFNHPEVEYIDAQPRLEVVESVKTISEVSEAAADDDGVSDELKRKKAQIEQAIARLDDAFLYAAESQARARIDYLVKRADMLQRLDRIDADIEAHQQSHNPNVVADVELFSRFLLMHSLLKADNIREQRPSLDRTVVRDFLQQA